MLARNMLSIVIWLLCLFEFLSHLAVESHWFALWHHTYISLSSLSSPVKIKYYLDTLVFLCQGDRIAQKLECLPASLTVWPSPKWVTESVLGSNGGWSDIDQLVSNKYRINIVYQICLKLAWWHKYLHSFCIKCVGFHAVFFIHYRQCIYVDSSFVLITVNCTIWLVILHTV